MTTPVCENCGSWLVIATDKPDSISLTCQRCGTVEWIWKDNEYEEDDEPEMKMRP
jgi:ribosomal protein S27AE